MKASPGGCYGSTALAIVAPRASWRKVLVKKGRAQHKPPTATPARGRMRSFCFCFSSLSGARVCRGPERSRARRIWARRSAPLTARTTATESAAGGKDLVSSLFKERQR